MARTFRRNRQMHPIAELNVTNLIDLGFTLLIIFMIATPLINQEQKESINLPIESKRLQTKPDPADVFETITIKADATLMLGGRQLTLSQLSQAMAGFAARAKPPVIRIRTDAKASMQQFISVVELLTKYNLTRVDLPTQTSG